MINPLPTSDRIDIGRLVSTSRCEHGQFMAFFRSRPGIAEVLRLEGGHAIVLLEPGFDPKEDWVLANKYSNASGEPDDGAFYSEVLTGSYSGAPKEAAVPARRLSHAESGGYIVRIDICQRISSQDGTISSAHSSRKEAATLVRPAYNRALLLLGNDFDHSKDWVLAGMSEGCAGGRRDKVGFCLAGVLPADFQSADEALQTIKSYLKLCSAAGQPWVLAS